MAQRGPDVARACRSSRPCERALISSHNFDPEPLVQLAFGVEPGVEDLLEARGAQRRVQRQVVLGEILVDAIPAFQGTDERTSNLESRSPRSASPIPFNTLDCVCRNFGVYWYSLVPIGTCKSLSMRNC